MRIWPTTLPQLPLLDGNSESPPQLVLRTQMDAGPAKTRRRFTAGSRYLSMQLRCTAAQVALFDQFYLESCAELFNWRHPRTGQAAVMRFHGVPTYTQEGVKWLIQMEVEILP